MNETIKAQKLNTGFWQKQAYSSTSSGAEVLNPVLPITPVKQRDREHPMNIDESPSDQNRDNLLHVTPPQRRKRIDSLYKELENFAAEENLTPTQVAALLLARASYMKHKDISKMAEQIAKNETIHYEKLGIEEAAYVYSYTEFGRRKWTGLKCILKESNHDIFPRHQLVNNHIKSLTPPIETIPEPYAGVRYQLLPALKLTLERQLQVLDVSNILDSTFDFVFKVGVDGSGDHKIFHQLKNVQTSNIIMAMICPLKISTPSNPDFWQQPNPSSSGSHRPLYLQLGKETEETMGYFGSLTRDCESVEKNPVTVTLNDVQYRVNIKIRITGLDRKAANSITGLGGAYCDICPLSESDCHDVDKIDDIHIHGRRISDTLEIVEKLQDEKGDVIRKNKDYDVRFGVTKKPTIEKDIESVQSLHLLLRSTGWYLKFVIHEVAGVNHWSEGTEFRDIDFIKLKKQEIQQHMLKKTALRLEFPDSGHGGTSTTGNTCRRLLFNKDNLTELCSLIPAHRRENMLMLGKYLSVILRVISSSSKVTNIDKFEALCREAYKFILVNWPPIISAKKHVDQVIISPSVHKLLGHSAELIRLNDHYGLGLVSEAGVESSNKLLRKFRINLARKTSQTENLTDCAQRLWLNGDPVLEAMRKMTKPTCKKCGKHIGHSTLHCPKDLITVDGEEDTVVKSFIVNS